jgi:hypothetical protein
MLASVGGSWRGKGNGWTAVIMIRLVSIYRCAHAIASAKGSAVCPNDVRIGTLRASRNLDWQPEISERNPQIKECRNTTDDEFAIKWIDIGEAARAIGTNEQLITIDDESPGLSIVAGRRKDSVADRKACFVYGCPRRRNTRWIDIPCCKIASDHISVPAEFLQ